MPNTAKQARICIIGAGAAGLSTAYFLKQRGYQDVVVLEKKGRVGGLCCSISYKSRSFDLGANYLTPAYKEVLKLAREVGAELYSEGPGQVYDPIASEHRDQPVFKSIMEAVMQGTDSLTFMGAIALLALIHRPVRRQQVPQIITRPSGPGKAMVNIQRAFS
jgi:monoamine oxidase